VWECRGDSGSAWTDAKEASLSIAIAVYLALVVNLQGMVAIICYVL
jgi:hypothetical protein